LLTPVEGYTPLSFTVEKDIVTVSGVTCDGSPEAFKKMLAKNTSIKKLFLTNIDGSVDDNANLELGRLIRKNGLTTYLGKSSHIASGGTDLYLAGSKREWTKGARIGVHSWSDGVRDGSSFPKDSVEHQAFLAYYKGMGIPEDFYWFTLNVADANNMHYMTFDELEKYKIVTKNGNSPVISEVPKELSDKYTQALGFDRYTSVTAPNGQPIHIIAQDKLSNNQIIRARSVLTHYLTNYASSEYGNDKSSVANKMAVNGATLLLLNGSDDGKNPAGELEGQPLYQNEIQVEGHEWYINQDYNHRDATFEEILHMVHDMGIGVDQDETFRGSLPAYQAEIRSAQVTALTDKIWGLGAENKAWIEELTEENSLSQEYLAAVNDSYYGLWGAWQSDTDSSVDSASDSSSTSTTKVETDDISDLLDETALALEADRKRYLADLNARGMWGIYLAKTRSEINTEDPLGSTLMGKFFHPYLTYNARIDESFDGEFSLRYDKSKPYTNHSQYLKDITLTGSKDANVIVNELDNEITGNSGNNTVIFSGDADFYMVAKLTDNSYSVEDYRDSGDGKVTVHNVENLQFKNSIQKLID